MNNKEWIKFELKTHLISTERSLNIDTNIIENLVEDLINKIDKKLKTISVNKDKYNYIEELIGISRSIAQDCYSINYDISSFKIFEYFTKDDLAILLKPQHTVMFISAVKEMAEHNNISNDLDLFLMKISKLLKHDIEEINNIINILGYEDISNNKVTNINQ